MNYGPRATDLTGQSPVLVIEAGGSSFGKQVHDLWEYRELFYFLTWRDIKVRYKQTILGIAWAVIHVRRFTAGLVRCSRWGQAFIPS